MSTAKIPAILLTALGVHISVSPPTPAIDKRERKTKDGPLDVHIAGLIFKTASWLHAAIELIIIGACWFPKSELAGQLLDSLFPGGGDASRIFLSLRTVVATVMMVVGSAIRYHCYREMGRHFTFHVTVLKDHKLVTTGLYSVVRHPGYTGLTLNFAGIYMWCFAQGSWLKERFLAEDSTSFCVPFATLLFTGFWATVTLRRVPAEDRILKEHFGKEWEQWASRVPYRLIPGVY